MYVCLCTCVGKNSICGDGNLLAAHWLTDVEGEGLLGKSGERVHGDEDGGMQRHWVVGGWVHHRQRGWLKGGQNVKPQCNDSLPEPKHLNIS